MLRAPLRIFDIILVNLLDSVQINRKSCNFIKSGKLKSSRKSFSAFKLSEIVLFSYNTFIITITFYY